MHSKTRRLVPKQDARKRFGDRSNATFHRWVKAGIVPAPIYICGRPFWDDDELNARVEQLLAERGQDAA